MAKANSNARVRLVALVGLFAAIAALGAAVPPLALAFAPAALIFAFLFAGRMPGEEHVVRLIERRRAEGLRRAPAVIARPRLPFVVRPTGRLIAAALAVRPPPHSFQN